MKIGLFFLVVGYLLSQFYRSFLAVLAGMLQTDIGVSADDLALSSGLWFLAFALMQLPVGWALDRSGPRRSTALVLGLGGRAARWLLRWRKMRCMCMSQWCFWGWVARRC